MKSIIEEQFTKQSINLINELELSFDYINNDHKQMQMLNTIKKHIKEEKSEFILQTLSELEKYTENLKYIINTTGKIKSQNFEFLNNIQLFCIDNNTFVDFGLFKDENKNTKKTLIQYLFNIYTNSFYYKMCCEEKCSVEEIQGKLNELLKTTNTVTNNNNKDINQINNMNTESIKFDSSLLEQKTGNESVDNLMANMLSNTHLLELANDISNTINEQNINPLSLLTTMMSGKPDKKVQNLISNITGKLETKISSGELDKDELQKNAEEFLSNGEMFNGIPFLGNLMKNSMTSNNNPRNTVMKMKKKK